MANDQEFQPGQHTSWPTFDRVLIESIKFLRPGKVLDIGAGAGKFGHILKPNVPETEFTALEPHPGAAETLKKYYDIVDIRTAEELLSTPLDNYEVIILGDVIEHMTHSMGRDLLEYLIYRSHYIFVITPECMPMTGGGDFFGCHNSIWRPEALGWHDLWCHARFKTMHMYVLRGYLGVGRPALQAMVDHLHATQAQILTIEGANAEPVKFTMMQSFTTDPLSEGMVSLYRPL